jgi:hypothetical protein
MIDLGSTVQLAVDVVTAGGVLVDPSAATLTVTLPDGTTANPVVPQPSVVAGQLRVSYAPLAVGHYSWQMVTTGPGTAYGDVFNVAPSASPAIMSLADAKQHLNITGSQDDDELRFFMAATTHAVERVRGEAIARRTVTERVEFTSPWPWFVLTTTPVLAVSSLVRLDSTQSWQPSDFDIDLRRGKLTVLPSGLPVLGQVLITYDAGYAVIPPNFQLAADIILKHMWETQRGTMGVQMGGDDYAPSPGSGYAVPNRAVDLLGGHVGGVA